jgi:hypothetical protein
MQVWHVIFMVGTKALLDGKLDREATRERDRRDLDEAVRRFHSAQQPNGDAPEA